MKNFLLACPVFLLSCAFVFAQTDNSVSAQQQQAEVSRLTRDYGRLDSKKIENTLFAKRRSIPFKMPVSKEQRRRLKPGERLVSKYAAFLDQPRTGLIKLFSDKGCEENANILRADSACRDWIPNSAFYSFREDEHTSDFLADISFKRNWLISNGVLSQGILTMLGDVPLENVSLFSDGIKYLADYQPAQQSREANKQFLEITRGIKFGNHEYRKAVPAEENMTYAVRVVAYEGRHITFFRGRVYNILWGDKRLDLIVAFRIIGTNDDGSINLLWKELSRKDAPNIIFPKRKGNRTNNRGKYQA